MLAGAGHPSGIPRHRALRVQVARIACCPTQRIGPDLAHHHMLLVLLKEYSTVRFKHHSFVIRSGKSSLSTRDRRPPGPSRAAGTFQTAKTAEVPVALRAIVRVEEDQVTTGRGATDSHVLK